MKHEALTLSASPCRWLSALLLPSLLFCAGCGGGGDSDGSMSGAGTTAAGGSTSGGGPTAGMASGGTPAAGGGGSACPTATDDDGNLLVTANEINDYSFTSTLTFPPILVKPQSELTFDWSALTTDFLGHPVDPLADIDQVMVVLWDLTLEELQTSINDDNLPQSDVVAPATLQTQKMLTSASLFAFGTPGAGPDAEPFSMEELLANLDPVTYPPESYIYTILVTTGTELGKGSRMIQSFRLDPASDNTQVAVTDGSTVLDLTVDLHSLQPTPAPVGNAAITIDWSKMMTNGLGHEFERNSIGKVVVAHYTRTPAELEPPDAFKDLIQYDGSVVADELWTLDVPAGEVATLAEATNSTTGANFTGITDSGTWMLALFCYSCRNPAPWYLTFLTPCSG